MYLIKGIKGFFVVVVGWAKKIRDLHVGKNR